MSALDCYVVGSYCLRHIQVSKSISRNVTSIYELGNLTPTYLQSSLPHTTTSIKFDCRSLTKHNGYPLWIEDDGEEFSTQSLMNQMSKPVLLEFLHTFRFMTDISIIEFMEEVEDETLRDYFIFNLDIFGGPNG